MKALRLLYAEDSALDADLTSAHFRETAPDFVLEILQSGEPCERRLAEATFDLLLLDNHLPDVDGIEVLSRVRRAGHRLPVVMLTGTGDDEAVAAALFAGADEYVTKGGDYLSRLPELLREVVNRSRLRAELGMTEGARLPLRRIVYLEQEDRGADAVERLLRKEAPHCHLQIVRSPEEARAALAAGSLFDVAILSIQPGQAATMLCHEVRRLSPDLPLIVLTVDDNDRETLGLLKLGVSDLLVKQGNYAARLPYAIDRALQRVQIDRTNRRLRTDLQSLNRDLEHRVRERTAELEAQTRERELAQAELLQAGQRYASTLENMLEGCQIIDADWRYLFVNEAAARQGRKEVQELIGKRMGDAYPGIEQTELFRLLRGCMAERRPIQAENHFHYEDGSDAWFDLRIEPVPEGLFILTIDISARKAIESEVAKVKDDLAVTLQSIGDAVIATDSSGFITRMNATAERLTGWSFADARGRPLADCSEW